MAQIVAFKQTDLETDISLHLFRFPEDTGIWTAPPDACLYRIHRPENSFPASPLTQIEGESYDSPSSSRGPYSWPTEQRILAILRRKNAWRSISPYVERKRVWWYREVSPPGNRIGNFRGLRNRRVPYGTEKARCAKRPRVSWVERARWGEGKKEGLSRWWLARVRVRARVRVVRGSEDSVRADCLLDISRASPVGQL